MEIDFDENTSMKLISMKMLSMRCPNVAKDMLSIAYRRLCAKARKLFVNMPEHIIST